MCAMRAVLDEIHSQPRMWRRTAQLASASQRLLPSRGERVAAIGCGTSLYMAQAWAAAREAAGHGETDAFTPSEALPRHYDAVVAISRSGSTTEVCDYMSSQAGHARRLAVTGDPASAVVGLSDHAVLLDYADERSPMQTRFATSALALLRAHIGVDIDALAADAERALVEPLPVDPKAVRKVVLLGHGLGVGVAREAALKLEEAVGAWTEALPSSEFRHGPNHAVGEGTVVWAFDPPPVGLAEMVEARGATFVGPHYDPMVELVLAQRLAVALIEDKGLDPDGVLGGLRPAKSADNGD